MTTKTNTEANESDETSGKQIGTLVVGEDATANDIEAMIDYGLESAIGIEAVSNQDGTYDIIDTNADPA